MYYKSEIEFKAGETCIQKFVLTGAESLPDVDVGKRKYALNIILPSSDETGEIRLVFENVNALVYCFNMNECFKDTNGVMKNS